MKDIFAANQRIIVLQGCEKSLSLSNEMCQRLLKLYGHSLSIQQINDIFDFLELKKFVTLEKLDEHIRVIRVTRKGRDVALGFTRADGIDPPVTE